MDVIDTMMTDEAIAWDAGFIAEQLRLYRQLHRLTQENLAEICGLGHPAARLPIIADGGRCPAWRHARWGIGGNDRAGTPLLQLD